MERTEKPVRRTPSLPEVVRALSASMRACLSGVRFGSSGSNSWVPSLRSMTLGLTKPCVRFSSLIACAECPQQRTQGGRQPVRPCHAYMSCPGPPLFSRPVPEEAHPARSARPRHSIARTHAKRWGMGTGRVPHLLDPDLALLWRCSVLLLAMVRGYQGLCSELREVAWRGDLVELTLERERWFHNVRAILGREHGSRMPRYLVLERLELSCHRLCLYIRVGLSQRADEAS